MVAWRRTWALVRKETTQVLRDRRTLILLLVMPVLELFLFAYAVSLSLEDLPTAIVDASLDEASRGFVQGLEVSGTFLPTLYLQDEEAVLRAIDRGDVKVGVVIPPGFRADLEKGSAQVLIIMDGSDSFAVSAAYGAATMVAQEMSTDLVMEAFERSGASIVRAPVETSVRVLYNPNLDDVVFLVPGLAAMLLQVLTVNQTAMAIVRERELGVVEQILATPARPWQIMIGKLVPNAVLSYIDMLLIVIVGVLWFHVPIQGSIWLFLALSLLFVVSGLGLGLLVSTVANTQQEAQQISGLLLLLTMMLTGLIYPRAPMPTAIKWVGNLLPATYSTRIARGIITKGVGLDMLRSDVLALAGYSLLVVVLAARTFRTRLD